MLASNRFYLRFLSSTLLALLVMIVATSCRRQEAQVLPTAQPTFTATPRSTPLPVIATSVPPGQKGNPITMVLQPAEKLDNAKSLIEDLEAAILESAQLEVRIELVENEAQTVVSLCGSTTEDPIIAWVTGVAVLPVQARNCARSLLQVEKGKGTNAAVGTASSIIVRSGIDSFEALDGRTFCRIDVADSASWLIPSLMLQANSLNITLSLKTITDNASVTDLVKAVASGKCDAGGIPEDAFETYSEELKDAQTRVTVLATSPKFPYGVLMLPSEIDLGTQTALQDVFLKLAKDRSLSPKLRQILGQDALVEVSDTEFLPLTEFAATTGLDFSLLGS